MILALTPKHIADRTTYKQLDFDLTQSIKNAVLFTFDFLHSNF